MVTGWRSPHLVHRAENIMPKMMMKIGLMELTRFGLSSMPRMFQLRRSSEYTAMTVNCCWYSAQNTAFAIHRGMNAVTRERSSEVTSLAVSICANRAIAPMKMKPMTQFLRLSAVIRPVASRMPRTTTMPTSARAKLRFWAPVKGVSTWCTEAGRFLRVSEY